MGFGRPKTQQTCCRLSQAVAWRRPVRADGLFGPHKLPLRVTWWDCYGSEGWGFESLRARSAQLNSSLASSALLAASGSLEVRHAVTMRAAESVETFRRNVSLPMVWMLSKLTTQSVGTPSSAGVSSSSETRWRRVRVKAATTTAPIRSATGSRVNTRTGRSPPGVAANQISPRFIGPVRPILGRLPNGYLGQGLLAGVERPLSPGDRVVLAR